MRGLSAALMLVALCAPMPLRALDRVYQEPGEFVATTLQGKSQAKVLWLTADLQAELQRILGHSPTALRQRYWTDGEKTVWVLEEIGKEEPITAGFAVRDGRIEAARVLVYRESRGGEVRFPSFVSQFQGAQLQNGRLDRRIDGIAGATLSVHAMERMAREALYLDRLAHGK